jgi:hypothetical protein
VMAIWIGLERTFENASFDAKGRAMGPGRCRAAQIDDKICNLVRRREASQQRGGAYRAEEFFGVVLL